ncbi:MAG: hypothetical protein NTV22_01205 [bacterium]|nr:hypothetical protein [bacterium]
MKPGNRFRGIANTNTYILTEVWLGDGNDCAPPPLHLRRYQATNILTGEAWSAVQLTMEQAVDGLVPTSTDTQ